MKYLTLGEKIKLRRKELGLTQRELAEDKMTRNMLSLIESDKAMPSYQICEYLASRLMLPLPYLFSGKDDLDRFRKEEHISKIKELFANGSYQLSLNLSLTLEAYDDEINLIIYKSSYELGKECILKGSLEEGYKYLTMAEEYANKSIYIEKSALDLIKLYKSVAESFQSPMLEFDRSSFENAAFHSYEVEFYRYLTNDFDFKYRDELLGGHIEAKRAMKANRYHDALEILKNLVDNKSSYKYNAFAVYSVFSDIENVYRQLLDYENAYRFSTKRISLLNAFNS